MLLFSIIYIHSLPVYPVQPSFFPARCLPGVLPSRLQYHKVELIHRLQSANRCSQGKSLLAVSF
jgi:hypothetical protein